MAGLNGSTKGRGIIKAQQGTVARPNPKENKDNPDRVNVQHERCKLNVE